MSYTITIAGTDRTDCFIHKTITIKDSAGEKPSRFWGRFYDNDDLGAPSLDDEIIITKGSSKIFGGYIINAHLRRIGGSKIEYSLQAVDYNRVLDRNLVTESYEDKTDTQVINAIVTEKCSADGITTNNVGGGVTFGKIAFNYQQPSQCLKKICRLTGRSWYLDYDKDIHYFTTTTSSAPFDISSSSANYKDFTADRTNTDIRNRVYVRGGTYLSDETTITMKADGEQTVFWLPDKPHDFSLEEGGVSKTVGIKNIDDPADYDYMLSYQEKYVETTGSAPAADTVMTFSYKYNVPVLVAVEDTDSIEEIGQFEYAIFDNEIETVDDARDRAKAELTDYAETIVDASFKTRTDGFRAGQYMNIDLTEFGINDKDYLVQSVKTSGLGGDEFEYKVKLASTQKLGIINFLIQLLENDKNFLEIDPDEVVDELFEPATQTVGIAESITKTMGSDDAQWGSFKWDLAQWQ